MLTCEVSMSARTAGGHFGEGARSEGFEDEGVPFAADAVQLACNGGGDGEAALVGDERDFLVGLDAQAGGDRVAGAGGELGGERGGAKVWYCLCCLINHWMSIFRVKLFSRIACYCPVTEILS